MPNWYDSSAIVILFIFFIELLIARRIFRTARKNSLLKSTQQNQMFVLIQPSKSQRDTVQYNTINGRPIMTPQQTTAKFILARSQRPPHKTSWRRFSFATCLGSVFLITYLTISYLLRPFTNAWGLYLLPILIPLPFLALPSLLQSRTFSAFGFLLCGFGLGFLFLFLL